MTQSKKIELMICVAEKELGYLEKSSNSNLNDKEKNAGYANYTKYWRDIKPEWQGQPYCAAFVSWVLKEAFGQEVATKLLKHWPYTYCPTMASLFVLNSNPKVGDIVIFYRNGEFAHTGIVIEVNGDWFATIEGNASGASGITPNGGGVVRKEYYNSQLPGTKFCTLDWSVVPDNFNNQSSISTSTTTTVMGMKLTDIAKYVNAEFGMASGKNYNCLLGVAQCMKDMAEVGGYGNTLSVVLKNNFTKPSSTYTEECLQAVQDVFVNGKLRFPNARILQFRSFSKYSDGNGNPDKNKCASVLAKYDYLGADSLSPSIGHLYFGKWLNGQNTKPQTSSSASNSDILRIGSVGVDVKELQTKLNVVIGSKLVVDGEFGAKTDAAVRLLQRNNNLVVDGEYGPITKEKLVSLYNSKMQTPTTSKSVGYADKKDKSLSGTYKTTENLNLRYKAGVLTSDNVMTVIPKGDPVSCYGYYTVVSGKKWLYVAYKDKSGFVSVDYLTRS